MASTIPTGVNPCLRDYTEYLSDKTGLKEHVLFDLLNQYVQERGAQQPGVYLVKFIPTKVALLGSC